MQNRQEQQLCESTGITTNQSKHDVDEELDPYHVESWL